jgi:thioredoxin-related protein
MPAGFSFLRKKIWYFNLFALSLHQNIELIMKRLVLFGFIAMFLALSANAQTELKKVYNEEINPMEQIDQAVIKAKADGKFVVCQVGGNWCIWCLRFADFITNDTTISKLIDENFEYIHVNYHPRKSREAGKAEQAAALMKRLNQCGRFGFPVFVILDEEGKVIHIQDSGFLEEDKSYNKEKVLQFFKNWTPKAVKG